MKTDNKRFLNQKFIALILIITSSIGLVSLSIITPSVFQYLVIVAYLIFVGGDSSEAIFESLSFRKDKDKDEDSSEPKKE